MNSVAAIEDDSVVRKTGWFYKEKIRLADIKRVAAVVRDALTYEEIVVVFSDDIRHRVWLSEFDKNFSEVMNTLATRLPGFVSPEGLAGEKAFEKVQRVLWEREESRSQTGIHSLAPGASGP
jgi:hypothetical protein